MPTMPLLRIGILPFGARDESEAALAEALRAAEIDVILADAPVDSFAAARDEASRLARADCDGILLHIAPHADVTLVSMAALHLVGTPLLLSGPYPPPYLDAAGVLAEIGVPFERNLSGAPDADLLKAWLNRNSKVERQRGRSAAGKLYGQRLAVGGNGSRVDAAQWMHQFGVIIDTTENTEEADFSASDGDAYGALTRRLLTLIHPDPDEPVYDLLIGDPQHDLPPIETSVTLARISPRRGHCRCVLLTGVLHQTRFTSDCRPSSLSENLLSGKLHAIAGSHLGAMRAACEALDIESILLLR